MLREIYVAQKETGVFRRWFEDDYFELIVWYNLGDRNISGFQLCYDRSADEHSLTWQHGSGYSHNRIDDGRSSYKHPATPVLARDGYFPAADILLAFVDVCGTIDKAVSRIVAGKLVELIRPSAPDADIANLLPGADTGQIRELRRLLSGGKTAVADARKPGKNGAAHNHLHADTAGTGDAAVYGDAHGTENDRGRVKSKTFRGKIKSIIGSLFQSGATRAGEAGSGSSRDGTKDDLLKKADMLAKKLSRSRKK